MQTTIVCANIHIVGVPEGKREKKVKKEYWKEQLIRTPQIWKTLICTFKQLSELPSRSGHVRHKISKPLKDRFLKTVREKGLNACKGSSVRLTAGISSEMM